MNSQPITITETAAEHVALFAEQNGAPHVLRVGIRGGGCSGFQYQLAFDVQRPGDLVFESNGIELLIAADALPYLQGAEVDFEQGLMGSGFKVTNPNAVGACGCGNSFRVTEDCGAAPSGDDTYL